MPVAVELVQALASCERVISALRVRLGHRVTTAGAHQAAGDRDATSYLSRVSRSSPTKVRAELCLAEKLEELPAVAAAYEQGQLSTDQAQVVAGAARANPAATGRLLAAALSGSFKELRDLATRCARAARSEVDEVERERRIHARRYVRTWAPADGGLRIDAWVTTVQGAKLLAALTKKTDRLLEVSEEPVERLRADALVQLCTGKGIEAQLLVRADAGALVRGEVDGDEVCEVDGVGPISVTAARSLLGEAFCTLLVAKGSDISTVTSTTRVVPRKVRMALRERDRCCVVPGCGATLHLEIDHWRLDFAKGGLTALDNLCCLCSRHHQMKTEGGWRIFGGPGRWRWAGPPRRAGPPARP